MTSCSKQNRAALLELRELPKPLIPEQGGSRGQYTATRPAEDSQGNSQQAQDRTPGTPPGETPTPNAHTADGPTAAALVGGGFHRAYFSTLRHLDLRRHLDRRT